MLKLFQVDQNYNLDCRLDEKDRLQVKSGRDTEDDISDTFEEYLEKSNMLCNQDGTEHYFLPYSQKSDFV